jgi:hypothetical protein
MKERQHWHAVLAPLVTGALAGVALWILLVPWDLSEVDSSGRPLANGGDDQGGSIGLVAVLLTGAGVLLALSPRTERAAPWFAAGGLTAWAVLFAWRAGAAETVGANMFLAPLVVVVVPVAIGVPLLLGKVSSARRHRRSQRA